MPLFYWKTTLDKLFTHIASPYSLVSSKKLGVQLEYSDWTA